MTTMENTSRIITIGSDMTFVSRDVCSELTYQIFSDGFHQQIKTSSRHSEKVDDIGNWRIELFGLDNYNENIIWFRDRSNKESYFGEFWLLFAEEHFENAERAYKMIYEFLYARFNRLNTITENELADQFHLLIEEIKSNEKPYFLIASDNG